MRDSFKHQQTIKMFFTIFCESGDIQANFCIYIYIFNKELVRKENSKICF